MTDEKLADAAASRRSATANASATANSSRRYANQVFAVAWCRLGDRTWRRMPRRRRSSGGSSGLDLLGQSEKFGAWITTIARNAAINLGLRHRNELKNRRRWMLEAATTSTATTTRAGTRPTSRPTAEDVRDALAKLPPIHRECLALFYLEGKSVAEAAAVLGLSESTFKTRLHRAGPRLRSLLETQARRVARAPAAFGPARRRGDVRPPGAEARLALRRRDRGGLGQGAALLRSPSAHSRSRACSRSLWLHRWLGRKEGATFPRPPRASARRTSVDPCGGRRSSWPPTWRSSP